MPFARAQRGSARRVEAGKVVMAKGGCSRNGQTVKKPQGKALGNKTARNEKAP
jgi:hypothetical protein